MCERLNCIIGISVRKIMSDTICSINIAFSWAISARNALQNYHGYSPNQLVFGHNPVLPNIYGGSLPGLENKISSQLVADNLNVMHSARVEFVKNEYIKYSIQMLMIFKIETMFITSVNQKSAGVDLVSSLVETVNKC